MFGAILLTNISSSLGNEHEFREAWGRLACRGMRRGFTEPSRRPIAEGVQGAPCAGTTTWGDRDIGGATSKGLRVRLLIFGPRR